MVEKKIVILKDTQSVLDYKSPRQGGNGLNFPGRQNIRSHGELIIGKLSASYEQSQEQKRVSAIKFKSGTYLEFSGAPGYDLALNKLESTKHGIRLLNVREELESSVSDEEELRKIYKATVYVPQGKEPIFLEKFKQYAEETTEKGNPRQADLGSSVEDVKIAFLNAFWIGKPSDMPDISPSWCEVWLRYPIGKTNEITLENRGLVLAEFASCCELLDIDVKDKEIIFPERIVKLIHANKEQLNSLIGCCDFIAEIRKAIEEINFLDDLTGSEQREWIEELLDRATFSNNKSNVVCILDTGVAAEHPLIKPTVSSLDVIQSVEPSWGVHDHQGHGTEMAGVVIYNDLKEKLASSEKIEVSHGIESVKILPPSGANESELYGAITQNAVYMSEIENPTETRTICMAITADDYNTDDGSPTSWSASIDNLTAGVDSGDTRRLFVLSAGNVGGNELVDIPYPEANILHGVENPGQAWNAITVGAYSDAVIQPDEFYPVADVGELSPYSSTSVTWKDFWPIKPEIVLNGGNMVTNGQDFDMSDELSILTTGNNFLTNPLSAIWGTSSATAQASWIAAQIYKEYPYIWPETVRALIIHSADWTDKMKAQFCHDDRKTKGRKQLLRTCGYGIPDLNKAIECKENSVNLVIEGEVQPFNNGDMNEMHIHELPWPKEVLQSLGEVDAKLKVTLSYFIEPGPGEIGWKNKYRYPSAGLRFDVINNNEDLEDFQKRINALMREERNDSGDGSGRDWYLGKGNRDVGSIHSDFCVTSAVGLCEANYVAVYPVVGWWRERKYLGRSNEKLKYSLVVSIETPEVSADLYSEIMTQIQIAQPIQITY